MKGTLSQIKKNEDLKNIMPKKFVAYTIFSNAIPGGLAIKAMFTIENGKIVNVELNEPDLWSVQMGKVEMDMENENGK